MDVSICENARIIDGDSIEARCDGQSVRLRLHCIDAPERAQAPWGALATQVLAENLPEPFQVRSMGRDRYQRWLVEIVLPSGREISDVLVASGAVAVYQRYCPRSQLYVLQAQAQAANLGIWQQPGLHQTPWAWRRLQRN